MRISDWSSDVCSSDLSLDADRTARRRGRSTNDRLFGFSRSGVEPSAADGPARGRLCADDRRSEEHTSELQSLMRISYAVFCLKKKKQYQKKSNIKYEKYMYHNCSKQVIQRQKA